MGKFKELAIEIQQIKRDQQKRQLKVKYPSIADFIEEAFNLGEEDKVYKLILALRDDVCDSQLH